MNKYKLTLSYDGTHYSGWQAQANGVSIQTLVEQALGTALRAEVALIGSGRTDSGVHALAQTAHFCVGGPVDLYRLLASLNGLLPRDIRVERVEAAPHDFHARYSAKSKTYFYHLHLESSHDSFKRLYSLHVPCPIDLALLRQAAGCFVGTHDFTSFTNEGGEVQDKVRTLFRLDVAEEPGGVRLEFEGDGFLYKMVRTIVGTLLEVASRKRALEEIPALFAAKDRRRAGPAAPAHGLFLVQVDYGV